MSRRCGRLCWRSVSGSIPGWLREIGYNARCRAKSSWAARVSCTLAEAIAAVAREGNVSRAAVRLHLLRSKGMDPAAAFLARHSEFLQQGELP